MLIFGLNCVRQGTEWNRLKADSVPLLHWAETTAASCWQLGGNPFPAPECFGAGLVPLRGERAAGFCSVQWRQLYLALTVPLKSDVIIPGMCTESGASKSRNKVLHCTREWWTHFETIKSLLRECHSWWMSEVLFVCVSTETVFKKADLLASYM